MATTSTMYPSVPRPLFDLYPGDYLNQDYQIPINDNYSIESGESLYPQSDNGVQAPSFAYPLPFQKPNGLSYDQAPQVVLPPTFLNNDITYGGMAPGFLNNGVAHNGGLGLLPNFQPYTALPYCQTRTPSFTTTPSLPSTSSSTSLQQPLAPSLAPLVHKQVQKAHPKSKEKGKSISRNAAQSAKEELLGQTKRKKRGPNRRPGGTSFPELLGNLPPLVRKALEQEFKGCCDLVNTKDASTRQKHIFSNRHCRNLSDEYLKHVPNFVCPAFVDLSKKCKSKAGRYDSTDRHCQGCVGFQEILSTQKEAHPIVITRARYNELLELRTGNNENEGKGQAAADQPEANDQTNAQVDDITGGIMPADSDEFVINDGESNPSQTGIIAPDITTHWQSTLTSMPVPVANHSEQLEPSCSMFEPVGADEWNFDSYFVSEFLQRC